jgi:glycosyltransferase involved in cell wall biosynthesis
MASQTSVTVRALRDIGINARGLVRKNTPLQDAQGIEVFHISSRREHPIQSRLQRLSWWRAVVKAIRWADVVHWHGKTRALPRYLDLRYVAHLNKARLVEFWGSDIRIPEIASADNPYIAALYEQDPEEAAKRGRRSRRAQARFAKYRFECLIPGVEMEPYVQEDLFPRFRRTKARLITSEFEPRYPDPGQHRPVVVHMPSSKAKKGTDAIVAVVEALKREHQFEFQLIHGVEHSKALDMVPDADIMIDEVVSGDYGVATLEAMALGKPIICYLKPLSREKHPPDCPIVSATSHDLAEVLKGLLGDGQRRHDIGRRSRAYVEKHHDAHTLARDLVGLYEELLEKTRKKRFSDEDTAWAFDQTPPDGDGIVN